MKLLSITTTILSMISLSHRLRYREKSQERQCEKDSAIHIRKRAPA